jgi:ribonuclease HII
MIIPTFQKELTLLPQGFFTIAGIDEVGRGCWAGPVVAAAVIFPTRLINTMPKDMPTIRDSKTLSAKQRQTAEIYIKQQTAWAVGEATPAEIDSIGISKATKLAMQRATLGLSIPPDYLLFDGRESVQLPIKQESIIDGDATILTIAAASIIAKVYRDTLMTQYDTMYPGYDFTSHVGYGTPRHIAALEKLGISPIHRTSYKPINAFLQ